MTDYSWKQAFKDMPAYIADGFRDLCAYWKAAHPVLWTLQIVYLIILVSVFYFVTTYTVEILESDVMPAKTTIDFWWIILTPFTQVGLIILVWRLFTRFAEFIVKTFNIPNPDEKTKA